MLMESWHETRARVISLNYDTLVERAAGTLTTHGGTGLSIDNYIP